MAGLPRETALRIALDAGLGRHTGLGPDAITTLAALTAELDQTAARGYGMARAEAEDAVGACAVAVITADGIVGTMSIAAPLSRLGPERVDALLPHLARAAQSMALAWRKV
ncbi:MAG: IclR family transcriptional regulator domain-containing protein [Gemmobacter sp.]